MKTSVSPLFSLILCLLSMAAITSLGPVLIAADDDDDAAGESLLPENDGADRSEERPATADEARGRARLLYEVVHGALQVMHRDFFGDGDEDLNLPSQSLEDVFAAIADSWGVEVRWLGVNATKASDHEPEDDFEEEAAKALAAGKLEYETVERGKFRYVGAIQIRNECLKCHVPNRTSLEDRVGGLAISIPLKKTETAPKTAAVATPAASVPASNIQPQ